MTDTVETVRKAERRRKLVAMAEQTASPAEAEIARNMLAAHPESRLERIASDIKSRWVQSIDSQFEIGRLLIEAATLFPPMVRNQPGGRSGPKGSPYSEWFMSQDFPFGMRTAWRLREAAEREDEVRAFITQRSVLNFESTGRVYELMPTSAVDLMNRKPKPIEALPAEATTPSNPAYAALRAARNAILSPNEDGEPTRNAFLDMHVDDLSASAVIIKELALAYNEAKNARR